MIGKAGLGNYAKGILEYCYYEKELSEKREKSLSIDDVRGELIYVQHLGIKFLADRSLDLKYMASQFLDNMDKNRMLTKFMRHQSFSFPPGEKPANDKIINIATEFAREFGFEQNQMLVFKHTDTTHDHFHIVANRLDYNGKNTADHFNNYARTGKFCRRMELELGFTITPGMRLTSENRLEKGLSDKVVIQLKNIIDQLLPSISSLAELENALKEKGYKTYIGRGIAFFNPKNRMKVKGSEIGREYSLANLERRLGKEIVVEKILELPIKRKQEKQIGLRI